MKLSEVFAEMAEEAAKLEMRAEYYGETVAAGYFDAAGGMLLQEAKRLKEAEEAEEAGE